MATTIAMPASVVDSHPDQLAFVPAIDPDGDDPAAEMTALMAEGSVAGVRLFGVHTDPTWLTDGRGRAAWELAGECDITVVPTVFPEHLAALRTLVTQMPDVRVAIDHCAFPDLRSGPPYPGSSALLALAECPSIHLKITSIVLRDAALHGGSTAFVEQLVESFGADRLCWGSDHPQTMELLYPEMLELARDAVHTIDAAAQRSILDRTARELFWRDERMSGGVGLDRSTVVETAASLMDEQGPEAFTLARLAARLGIRSQSIYAHVDGLDNLRRELALLSLGELSLRLGRSAMGRTGRDGLHALAHTHASFAMQRPGLYACSLRSPDGDEELAQAIEDVTDPWHSVLASFGLRPSENRPLPPSLVGGDPWVRHTASSGPHDPCGQPRPQFHHDDRCICRRPPESTAGFGRP